MNLIENPHLLKCRFKNGMMMLPYYHSIIEAKLNNQSFAVEGAKKVPIKQQILSLLKGIWHCKVKKKDILIFSSTLFNVQRDGSFYNYLHGYYYDLYPNDTLLLEDGDTSFLWRTSDSYENLSFINTYIELICLILRKGCHTFAPIHSNDYEVLINEYPNFFTIAKLSKDDYFTKFYAFFIRKLLKKIKPKVLLVNCASYGHTRAILCYVAKQLGIKVIEPQHGVTYNCSGYVTSEAIANSKEYREYLPDTLFTFGDYWNEFVNWKYEKKSVGYQYLNEYVSKNMNSEITHDFLVISQPMNKKEEKNKEAFVKALCNIYQDKKVLFRIHPSEDYVYQKSVYKECKNLEISNSTKVLYEDFNRSKHIIGWFSNCLYECLAFKRVPIIVDTQYTREAFPHNIGIWVKSPNDLQMIDLDTQQNSFDYTKYWATDFENNVKYYIDKLK